MKRLQISTHRGIFGCNDHQNDAIHWTAAVIIKSMLASHSHELIKVRHFQSLAENSSSAPRHFPKNLLVEFQLCCILYNLDIKWPTE